MARSPKFYKWFDSASPTILNLHDQTWNGSTYTGIYPPLPVGAGGALGVSLERIRYAVSCVAFIQDDVSGDCPIPAYWPVEVNPTFSMPSYLATGPSYTVQSNQFSDANNYPVSEGLVQGPITRLPAGGGVRSGTYASWHAQGDSECHRPSVAGYPPTPHLWMAINPYSSIGGFLDPDYGSYLGFTWMVRCLYSQSTPW